MFIFTQGFNKEQNKNANSFAGTFMSRLTLLLIGVMKFILVSKLLAEGLREVLSCLSKAKLFNNCC